MTKITKNNIRKCVLTSARVDKSELLRVVRTKSGLVVDLSGKQVGRGAYITPDATIIKQAAKKNSFARSLRMKVDISIYEELLKVVAPNE